MQRNLLRGRDVFSIPILGGKRIYSLHIYIYIYLFPPPSEYISRASHALASLVIPCILRDILEWREANGNRQMIHEDVKRDVEKRS